MIEDSEKSYKQEFQRIQSANRPSARRKGGAMIEDSERPFGEIIYHFDLSAHSLPLKQFVDTAYASQTILDDFNEHIFDKKIRYELRVLPSEEGGFIEVLGLVTGGLWGILGTDIGKAYFRGLTEKEPSEWVEGLGEKHRKWLNRNKTTEIEIEPEQTAIFKPVTEDERVAETLIEFLVSFLAANMDKLQQVGLTPEKFRRAFQARNAIYEACIDNPEIEGLAFDRSHDFPIKRADFPKLITQIPDQVDVEADVPMSWSVESVDIVVNSPNWNREGRKWQGATNKHKDIAFSIEDDSFWYHVQIKDIQPDIRDNLKIQWAYPVGLSKPSHVRALRVLSYNGTKISDPMTDAELQAEFGKASIIEPDVPGLFDHLDDNHKNNKDKGED